MQLDLFAKQQDDGIKISSLEISRLTGKLHQHVKRDIDEQLGKIVDTSKFGYIYKDTQNRQQTAYSLPKREALILVSGYSIELRAKIIDRLQQLEDELKNNFKIPQTYAEALMIASQQAYQIEEQQKQLELQAPKVKFAEMVNSSEGTVDIATYSKILFDKEGINIGEKRLFAWMRNNQYLMTNGSDRNKPYQRYLERGLFKMREGVYTNQSTGDKVPYTKTVLTGKGQVYFSEKLRLYFAEKERA